jgi:hypothetical protein
VVSARNDSIIFEHVYKKGVVVSSGIKRRIIRWKSTDASNKKPGFFYLLRAGFLLGLFFNHEDGGNTFLRYFV